jgi:hypothetical protein
MCPKTPDSPLENTSPMPVNSAIPSQLTPAEPLAAPITRPASRPIRPPAPCGPIPEAPADESLPFMVDVTLIAGSITPNAADAGSPLRVQPDDRRTVATDAAHTPHCEGQPWA